MPASTIDEWEAGLVYPTWDQFIRVAALTGLSADELLDAEDSQFEARPTSCSAWDVDFRRLYCAPIVQVAVDAHPNVPLEDAVVHGYQSAIVERFRS